MYSFLKVSVFLLFPLLTFAETYYEVRSSNGETSLQPASAVGNLEQVSQQQGQPQSQQLLPAQPQAPAQSSSGFQPFGSFSLEAPSFFGLGQSTSTYPFFGGALVGILLVFAWRWLFSGWSGSKFLSSKFYGLDEEVDVEPETGDLKKDTADSHKTDSKTEEAKSRRKRHALRLARTAGRVQRSIDDFEYKYRQEY